MTSEPTPSRDPGTRGTREGQGYAVRWHLVLPVKELDRAKTRLVPPSPLARPDLAHAMARDTLEAAVAAVSAERVLVVTSDARAVAAAAELGVRTLPDPAAGLDAAVLAGLRVVREAAGEDARTGAETVPGLAVLLGDLPSLRAEDLTRALVRCTAYPEAVVPDAAGTGTVLLTSTRGLPHPSFGPGSADRHARRATRLDLDLPRLRRDVDTVADLRAATALGVGRHTAAVLRGPGRPT